MSYSVEPYKNEETLKGYLGQLADVRAARMLINCRLSLLTDVCARACVSACVSACACVCVCIKEPLHYGIFFLATIFIHPSANILSFFILLTWILFLFRNRKKNPKHLFLLSICYTFAYL